MRTRTLGAFLLLLQSASAGTLLRNPVNGKPVRWPAKTITFQMSRTVHGAGGAGVDGNETAASVHAAVADAVRLWNQANGLDIRLELSNETRVDPAARSLITFTDKGPYEQGLCSPEFVACTLHWFLGDGSLLSVSIAFNPFKRHSSTGLRGTNDIGLVMLHELGHALGLGHSPALDAVMSPALELESTDDGLPQFPARLLAPDDVLTLASNYQGLATPSGRIRGTVRRKGQPAEGASVVALDGLGRVVQAAWTLPDGSWGFALPPGDYTVAVTSPAAEAGPVHIEAGTTVEGVELIADASDPPGIRSVGALFGDTYFGFSTITLARGRAYTLGVSRTSAGSEAQLDLPVAAGEFTGPEAALFPNAPHILFRPLQVHADAPLGAYALRVRSPSGSTLIPGAVRVAAVPQATAITGFDTGQPLANYRPGQRIRIAGTQLAPSSAEMQPWMPGAPFPTQASGVSVRIGGRFAELVSVSPEEIVAMIPANTDAGMAEVRVITGPAIESEGLLLSVLP